MIIRGRVWVLGDHINTDVIIPAKYKFRTGDFKELAKHVFEDLDPTL
ncbi:MAG: 3-isopropylmalate dehydratase small subunit, partial [Thermoproteota archaeon]